MPEQIDEQKNQQSKLILLPKFFFHFNEDNGYSHFIFLFINKYVKTFENFNRRFTTLRRKRRIRHHPIIILNVSTPYTWVCETVGVTVV